MFNKEAFKTWIEKTNKSIVPETHESITLSNLKNAAVAIILIENNSNNGHKELYKEYSIIFAKRSEQVPRHKGQIAFPGGRLEANETMQEAAMRETLEEIGINIDLASNEWEYLGEYPKNFITFSDYIITPFIFIHKPNNGNKLNYIPDGYEIVEVFDVPIKHLLNPENRRVEKREWQGFDLDIHFFSFNDKTIWGITGWLLHDFLISLNIK